MQLKGATVQTPHGQLGLWRDPDAPPAGRPLLIALCEPGGAANAVGWLEAASEIAEPWVIEAPCTPAELDGAAEAVDGLLAALAPGRALVAFAADRAAPLALRLRAPDIRRLVLAASAPGEAPPWAPLLSPPGPPADVLLTTTSDRPEPALAANPRVRLRRADGPAELAEALAEACRRASSESPAPGLDEALLDAAPLSARRVLYWGEGAAAFARAYLARNPAAELTAAGPGEADEPAAGGFDLAVCAAPPSAAALAAAARALREGGVLVARGAEACDPEAAGLTPIPGDEGLPLGLLRARKGPGPEPLRLTFLALASRLMDVRTRLPARALAAEPELIVEYVTPPSRIAQGLPAEAPKVLLVQRPMLHSLEVARRELAAAMAAGRVLVLEFDDHPALMPKAPGQNFTEADLPLFGCAHALQTASEPLAELFREALPEVRVFENAVFELAPFPAAPRPKRVFYGAVRRGGFAIAVARALASVLAAHPETEFVVVGDAEVFAALPTANKQFHPYLPYEAYLARMAECAVSLSPLGDDLGLEAKSDAKFLDAARAGVLTIASPVVYGRTIEHGVNGLIARGLEDWARLLDQALADPAGREAMSRRAWEQVRARRMFAGQAGRRVAWYRDLWRRREALNAAALARVPGLDTALRGLPAAP